MSHLSDFTYNLIENREGEPVAVSTIVSVFTNLGNYIPGNTAAEQRDNARRELIESELLAFDAEADTFDTRNDDEAPEDFLLRREKGLKDSGVAKANA